MQLIKFILGWLAMYLLFAAICLLANWKTMDFTDCLNNSAVWGWSICTGWVGGVYANHD